MLIADVDDDDYKNAFLEGNKKVMVTIMALDNDAAFKRV